MLTFFKVHWLVLHLSMLLHFCLKSSLMNLQIPTWYLGFKIFSEVNYSTDYVMVLHSILDLFIIQRMKRELRKCQDSLHFVSREANKRNTTLKTHCCWDGSQRLDSLFVWFCQEHLSKWSHGIFSPPSPLCLH